jgi:endonuclease-3
MPIWVTTSKSVGIDSMGRLKSKQALAQILTQLKQHYPEADCALNFSSPFELLVATILSAQCTDERVNQVTAELFCKYPSVAAFAGADLLELQQDIHPTGFFRNKALAIQSTARTLLAEHGGEVPCDLQALTALRGVGRKTAHVVMGNAFGRAEGVVVDTHVSRLSQRIGFTRQTTPEKIEQDLIKKIPATDWVLFPHLLIAHGRAICKARKPLCEQCFLSDCCAFISK